MNAIVISIGDELVSGLTVNTNAAWLGQQLSSVGVRTIEQLTVPDDLSAIASAIRHAHDLLTLKLPADPHGAPADAVGFLVITGGLGPTEDDVTRAALADAFNQELVEDPDAVVQIERFFRTLGRPMSASNRLQALRPVDAIILENNAGTAPGLRMVRDRIHVFVMPGVPREMMEMFGTTVMPMVREAAGGAAADAPVTVMAKINTFGRGESVVGERIRDLMARSGEDAGTPGRGGAATSELETPTLSPQHAALRTLVGTTVHDGIVSVRIYATGPRVRAERAAEEIRGTIYERLGALIFSDGDEPLESAVASLLRASKYTLATAESCTGGLLATLLTNTPGASHYFLRGWVTYANIAKHEDLSIPEEMIAEHGAVSGPVVRAMAEGSRKFAEADFCDFDDGVAGPDGGRRKSRWGRCGLRLPGRVEVGRWRRWFGNLFFRVAGRRCGCGRRRWGWRFCGGS